MVIGNLQVHRRLSNLIEGCGLGAQYVLFLDCLVAITCIGVAASAWYFKIEY